MVRRLALILAIVLGTAMAGVHPLGGPFMADPIMVYDNWSSYDELSDKVPLTEELTLKELDQMLRLKRFGARWDYYCMDAFWFTPDGAYRTWRQPNFPNGPDRWLSRCKAAGILPGLWFGSNSTVHIDCAPAWQSSMSDNKWQCSFSAGGFLPDLMDALEMWYGRGIRMFQFDFAEFKVGTPEQVKTMTPEQIKAANVDAFRQALAGFRSKHPDVVMIAFNGFGGDMDMTSTPLPFKESIDIRWLDVFDTLYCGDPRPSDVPEMSFWRSMDVYGDHMVRRYEQSHIPLERIDSTSCMIGATGTNYYRKTHAWKGMMALMLAQGGWTNTIHGNLELLTDADARWLAKVEKLYLGLQALGRTHTFGGVPGDSQPYGYAAADGAGSVYTVVNPDQSMQTITLPSASSQAPAWPTGRILFTDAGFKPTLTRHELTLGPGQMAIVGYGAHADCDLGVQTDVVIPNAIHPLKTTFTTTDKSIEAHIQPPPHDLRIVMQELDPKGQVRRTWPTKDGRMGQMFSLEVTQNGHAVPVHIDYDRKVWSGLSWAVGEVRHADVSNQPITIRCTSAEKDPVSLVARVYDVQYP